MKTKKENKKQRRSLILISLLATAATFLLVLTIAIAAGGSNGGHYFSLIEEGKTAGRQNDNFDYFTGSNINASTTVWFKVAGTNGNGTGTEADPYQLGEFLVPSNATQIYARVFSVWTASNINNLISFMKPNITNFGMGLTSTGVSGGSMGHGFVDVNGTGIFKMKASVASGELDMYGITVQGYVADP